MSKILIIGNGASALDKEYGQVIDSDKWDVVMRFNRWNQNADGVKHDDYSKHIGTRCDYWMINDLHLQFGIDRKDDYKSVIIYCPKFKYNSNLFKKIEESHSNVKFIPPSYEDYINENIIDFSPKWPSTGVIGMYFATLHFDEVFLYGFDTYDTKYDSYHYFEKVKKPVFIDHEPTEEKEFIKHMKENYNVKLLEDVL